MNGSAHPLAEVVVAQLALPFTIQVFQYLHQIKVVKQVVRCIAKEPHDVLRANLAIFVHIQVQEGLAHGNPRILEALTEELG